MSSTVHAPDATVRPGVRLRSLRVNVGLALAGDVATKAGGLVALVCASRLLPTAELGRLGIALALVTLLTAIVDLGASTSLVRDGARADAARLALGSAIGRLPVAALAALATVAAGAALGRLALAIAVLGATVVGAASLTVFATFRATQDLRTETQARFAGALAVPVGVVAATALVPGATAAVLGFTLGPAVALAFGLRRAARTFDWTTAAPPLLAASAGLPFAAMAIATLAYYRLGTFFLGASGDLRETAAFTLASTVGFGALALPNAITTGLLPRLAAETDAAARRVVLVGSLRWTVAACGGLAAAVGAFTLAGGAAAVFGDGNARAGTPLAILGLALVPIGVAGVLGTALVAEGRTRIVAYQVAGSLVVNLAACALLVGPLGATGAALATLATETVAVGALALPFRSRPLALPRLGDLQLLTLGSVGLVVAMQAWAIQSGYALRVISDTPSYLALLPRMAATPFAPVTAFMPEGSIDTHASPYTQALATLWQATGGEPWDPYGLAAFLAWAGIPMMLVFLHAAFTWFRAVAGSRAAWAATPVLLVLLGPAHVIWAGDFTFHGFLYAAYYPQTIGMALLLYTLVAVRGRPSRTRTTATALLVGTTMLVHPFTALLLCALLMTRGAIAAARREDGWQTGSWALVAGFLGAHAWPSFSVSTALGEAGVPGPALVMLCAVVPAAARLLPAPGAALTARMGTLLTRASGARAQLVLTVTGALTLLVLGVFTLLLFGEKNPDPLIRTNRLSLYWVEDRWRWPLMFAAGLLGVAALLRLAALGRLLPLLWFAGCFGAGVGGALGLPLPLWWRLVLFAQLPLALGVGVMLTAKGRRQSLTRLALAGLAATTVFKLATLLLAPSTITYFGTDLQDAYRLGAMLPKASGLVASDPFTSYFVPGASGHRVLVVTKAHVGSQAELARATAGYALLHRFYMGERWWQAARQMYRQGVRYVVIEKSTSLAAPDLETFSTGPTPLVRTERDRRLLGVYYYRNNRVGTLVYDRAPYTIYRLDPGKLFG